MPWCLVMGCRNNLKATKSSGKDVSYHIFPKDPKRRSAWIKFLNRPLKFNADTSYICSEHFVSDDFEYNNLKEKLLNIKVKRQLKKSAVPSINITEHSGEKQLEVSVGVSSPLNSESHSKLKNHNTISTNSVKEPENNSVSTLTCHVQDVKQDEDELVKRERKKLVDKLLADYEEQQKNKSPLKCMVTKDSSFFSPKINSNTKLADKLKLIKAIDNPETYSPPKKKKMSPVSNLKSSEQLNKITPHNKDQVIQVSAVQGGLMLHALPRTSFNTSNPSSEKNVTNEDEEIIIVTEDEASYVDLSLYNEEQCKENDTEVIIVTEETILDNVQKTCLTKTHDNCTKSDVHNQFKNNESQSTSLYTAKVSSNEDKGCQVIIPCKGCENRSFKINKLLRERTRLLKDLDHNGEWKDPDEITSLKKMNGVLSLLLVQCVVEKYGKKSPSIRVDLVRDSIERINRGWSMQDTSEALCQAFSVNAYDEFARAFEIVNEL